MFIKALNMWDNVTQKAVISGQIKLQTGQWVMCGNGHLSRFVCVRNKVIWLAHWQGSGKATQKRFNSLLQASKGKKENV
tara:strand:+ start:345 stop:581 length:237 start_codon:yes stop_codon:yes gene_type:complete